MAYLSGRNGKVTFGTADAINITEWNLNLNLNLEDMDIHGNNGWKGKVAAMNSWDATVSGRLDFSGTDTNTGQQDLLNNILGLGSTLIPTSLTVLLYADSTVGALKYYSGTAWPSSTSVKCDANGIIEIEFGLKGEGHIHYLTA